MSSRRPISACVRSSSKRSLRIPPVALGQRREQRVDDRGVLDAGIAALFADGEVGDRIVAVLEHRAVQRVREVRCRGRQRLEHLLDGRAGALGELGGRRGTTQLAGRGLDDRVQAQLELLHSSGDADHPAAIAEIALELAEDGRDGEARERQPAVGVEALDGLQETERCHLGEVVHVAAAG